MVTIEGTVESIIYQNEGNGYTVCDISSDENLITAVGCLPSITEGECLKLFGDWSVHPEYGRQFRVEMFEKSMPNNIEEIEKYLASGIIKGVRAVTARKIVDRFGEDTISVIQTNPVSLSEITGISVEKALSIGQAFSEQYALMNLVIFLNRYGISATYAVKIYKAYGKDSIEKVKENPYSLADDISGIGFTLADKIAMSLGVEPSSRNRIRSALKYILTKATSAGHTYMPAESLLEYGQRLLNSDFVSLEDALMSLQLDKSVYMVSEEGANRVYLNAFYHAELNGCKKLSTLAEVQFKQFTDDIDAIVAKIEYQQGIKLADLQREAVISAAENGVMVITGGPGTGKTTIIKTIIKLLEYCSITYALAAPTGRAAKKMYEATGVEAKTIHRLLEIGFLGDGEEQVFFKNEDNPLDAQAVIIDEMSMVDILLFNNLLKALAPGTRLIMVGDVNQLPSVGPGNVLKDIIDSGVVETVSLTEIFRQAQESQIVINAHKINNGTVPKIDNREGDFFLIKRKGPESTVKTIISLCLERIPKTYGVDPMNDIQVLTPTKKGPVGVLNLNNALQLVMNPPDKSKAEKSIHGFTFREGDKVMQIKNNYNLKWKRLNGDELIEGEGVFNGDTGLITRINHSSENLSILFDDEKLVTYDFAILDEIEPAYAVTIHKSQGSEFPVVIIPLLAGPPVLMTRNLLYTAVTRASQIVIIVGSERVFVEMVNNQKETIRYSGLREKIKKRWSICLTDY